MKKKTIVFFCLAVLFLLSAFSGFSGGIISGGIGCLVICGIFAFLAFRSAKPVTKASNEVPQTSNHFTPPSESSVLHDTENQPKMSVTSMQKKSTDNTNYEFVSVKVAGVTFNNDDGESRQTLLSLIRFERPPFTGSLDISLKQYDFRSEIAYAVCVNGYQIGNVPKSQILYVHENFNRILEVSKINVYGGGHNKAGDEISFGAEITLKMRCDT